jgi:tRNA 2-thiouridine synthesizing protein A
LSPPEIILDVKGLECPEPIRRAKLALLEVESGAVLRVLTTDPVAPIDFEAFCYHLPHELLAIEELAEHIEITIRKGS